MEDGAVEAWPDALVPGVSVAVAMKAWLGLGVFQTLVRPEWRHRMRSADAGRT